MQKDGGKAACVVYMGCMCGMGLPRKMRRCRRSLLKAENEIEWQKAMQNEMDFVFFYNGIEGEPFFLNYG